MTFFYIILVAIGCTILFSVVWRLASRRHILPCPAYLQKLVELDNPFTKTNRAAFIIDHLGLEPGMRVLDAGCGPGRLSVPAAVRVGSKGIVVAMDVQDGMLARAKEKVQLANLTNVTFLHAALGNGLLEHNHFDRALLVTVLGEIPDQRMALQEIFDALKPGGILSVTETIFDPHYQRRNTVTRLACEIGFKEHAFYGNKIAFVLNLIKSENTAE